MYEGNSVIGGRARTGYADDGQVFEKGGERINGTHLSIRRLVQEQGLRLDNVVQEELKKTEPATWVVGSSGQLESYPESQAADDYKLVWQTIKEDLQAAPYPTNYDSYTERGRYLSSISMEQYFEKRLDALLPDPRFKNYFRTAYAGEYGSELSENSALSYIYIMAYNGPGQLRPVGQKA